MFGLVFGCVREKRVREHQCSGNAVFEPVFVYGSVFGYNSHSVRGPVFGVRVAVFGARPACILYTSARRAPSIRSGPTPGGSLGLADLGPGNSFSVEPW